MKIRRLNLEDYPQVNDFFLSQDGLAIFNSKDFPEGVLGKTVHELGRPIYRVEETEARTNDGSEAAALRTNLDRADEAARAFRAELDTAYRTISRLSLALLDSTSEEK